MDKLTINELKGYLGTGLKIMENDDDGIFEMLGIYDFEDIYTDGGDIPFTNFKPLLYPLSSLTEYREDLGFVPIDNIKESQRHLFFREDLENQINGLDYSEMQKLLSWHFDCFNLIDRNLAINIKTLKDE
jgi:hypothetical protein